MVRYVQGEEGESGYNLLKRSVFGFERNRPTCRDITRGGFGEFVGWVRYLSQSWQELFQGKWSAMAMERLVNISDEVTEGRRNARIWNGNWLNEVDESENKSNAEEGC